jgi:hypothetical protein
MAERIAAIDHAVKEVSVANAFLANRRAPISFVKLYEYSNPYHVCRKTNWPLTAGSALVWNPLAGLQKFSKDPLDGLTEKTRPRWWAARQTPRMAGLEFGLLH